MRRILAAFIVPMALVMSACGASVTAGTVVEKNFTEAHTTQEEIMEQECEKEKRTTGTGKSKKTSYVNECEMEPTGEFEDVEHPAEYVLVLEDEEGNTGEVSVDESEYNSVEEGDFFDSK